MDSPCRPRNCAFPATHSLALGDRRHGIGSKLAVLLAMALVLLLALLVGLLRGFS